LHARAQLLQGRQVVAMLLDGRGIRT